MKIKPRNTHKRVAALRITAPVTRPHPNNPEKRQLLLAYIDSQSKQRYDPTNNKDLFVFAGGSNREGEPPSGLDRMSDTLFIVHHDEGGYAVGLDIIPSRLYRSGVVPNSQVGVTTMTIVYDVDGAVARITKRPFNTRTESSQMILRELDKIISSGKPIVVGMRLGSAGSVVAVGDNLVEVRIGSVAKRAGHSIVDLEDIAAEAE